jgi:hypothetical protein
MKKLIRTVSVILAIITCAIPVQADDKNEPEKDTHLIVDSRMIKILIKSLDSVTNQEEARQLLGEADYVFKGDDHQIWEYKWDPFDNLDIKLAMNQTVSSLGGFTLKFDKATGKKVFWGWIYSQRRLEPTPPELQERLDRIKKNNALIPNDKKANKPKSEQAAPSNR